MDVRGFGQTSARWADYSAHAVGRDALALIEHLKAVSAVILGNSFAAGSALWAAHDAPARVSGVVLFGPLVRDLKVPWFASLALKGGRGERGSGAPTGTVYSRRASPRTMTRLKLH